ncbi:DUF3099 domain-containing protein [Microbacterium sp. H1-D42]|nr:DUF3099 domain-containing protein [Microbacterium sp. H1-D42]UNK72540.1 DUF3099 domain-containing protein [Microbacterium sp. H1-D42]
MRRYALTMGIRTVCFLAMALVQPIGWWTWVFAAAAIFLPYVAVVYANAGEDSTPSNVESPVMQIEMTPTAADPGVEEISGVFTIREQNEASEQKDASGQDAPDVEGGSDAPKGDAR